MSLAPMSKPSVSLEQCIWAENLVVRYRGGIVEGGRPQKPALAECSLTLQKGLFHGLIGPGGCGKTTLLKVIATLIRPDSGSLSFFGQEVDFSDSEVLRRLRHRIGVQFQNLALFDFLDVFGNVAFPVLQSPTPPPLDEVARRAEEVLQAVGLAGASRLRINELSGGMQRRVAIARALMGQPELCIYDDPTSGLDPVNSSRIFRLLREVQQKYGITMIVSTHDVDRLAHVCDRVHVMSAGRVIFSGTVQEAMSASEPEVLVFFSQSQELSA